MNKEQEFLKKLADKNTAIAEKIKEEFPELFEKKLNVITQFPTKKEEEFKINNERAGSLFSEKEGGDLEGQKISGHKASLYLSDIYGTWFNDEGNEASGYFFYKPKLTK